MAVAPMCVEIPPRYCPLPTAVHPDTKLLQERGAKWLNSFGLCTQGHQRTRMLGNDCAGFYGRIMPEASTGTETGRRPQCPIARRAAG